jgi:hypothetical protein
MPSVSAFLSRRPCMTTLLCSQVSAVRDEFLEQPRLWPLRIEISRNGARHRLFPLRPVKEAQRAVDKPIKHPAVGEISSPQCEVDQRRRNAEIGNCDQGVGTDMLPEHIRSPEQAKAVGLKAFSREEIQITPNALLPSACFYTQRSATVFLAVKGAFLLTVKRRLEL